MAALAHRFHPGRLMRIGLWSAIFALLLAAVFSVSIFVFSGRADDQQSTLAKLISQALSSKSSQVTIGAVEGALSSNATIHNVAIADKNGVWLKVDKVELVWSRLALLRRRLEIDNLNIGKLEILRKPVSDPAIAAPPGSNEPLLPELPVKILVKAFALKELALGAPIIGAEVRLSAKGDVKLGDPGEGLDVNLAADRLDAEGSSKIRLLFVPKGENLTLDVTHRKSSGGIVGRAASIPGLPPVDLTLTGKGPLDNFAATLDFNAGQSIGAKGDVRLVRTGPGRRLQLDMHSRIEGLLPPLAAGIFAGSTTLKGNADLGDDGAVTLSNFRLASSLAELIITGKLEKDKSFDVNVIAQALSNDGQTTRHGQVTIGKLQFTTRAHGTFNKPIVDGKLEALNIVSADGGFDKAMANFSLKPSLDTFLALSADATIAGLRSPVKGFAKAAGNVINASIRASIDDKGTVDIKRSQIASPIYKVDYSGRLSAGKMEGQVDGELLNLSAFSELAGRSLKGRATINADISGSTPAKEWTIGFRSQANGLSLGDATLNRLAGGALAAKGRILISPVQLAMHQVSLIGRGLDGNINGRIGGIGEGLRFTLSITDAADIDRRLRGHVALSGLLSGTLDNPDLRAELRGARLTAIGKPVRDLSVQIDARQLRGVLQATLKANGSVDQRPLTGGTSVSKGEAGGWRLEQMNFRLGSANATGDVTIAGNGLATGNLSLDAPDLSHLSALLLTNMRGAVKAVAELSARDNGQDMKINAEARNIAFNDIRIGSAQANVSAHDLLNRPKIAGSAKLNQLRAAGETIGRAELDARNNGGVTAFTLRTSGGTVQLSGAGNLQTSDPMRIDLRSFNAARRGIRIALAAPATLAIRQGIVSTKGVTLLASGGRITIAGDAGSSLGLKIGISNLPLSIAKAVDPKLNFAGRLDGRAELRGTPASPTGPYSIAIKGFANRETRQAGVPRLDINLGGQLQQRHATIKGDIRGGKQIALRVDGSVPLDSAGAIALGINGVVDAGLANASLAGTGQRVTGRLALNATLRGSAARPNVSGSASLSGGSFRDPLQGIAFTNIAGRFSGRGDQITIDSLTAQAANGGSLSINGNIGTNSAAGMPANLRITAQKAQLISNDVMTLVAGLNMTVTGPLTGSPTLGGRIDIRSLNVNVPERLPASSAPLRGAKHIAPPPQTRARLQAIAKARQQRERRKRSGASGPRINLRIDAPNQVFVRGRGIDAELGGSVTVTGTTASPRANGAFELRRGRIDLLTQKIDISRGRLTFLGDIIPQLEFVAASTAGSVTAMVTITGQADDPKFAFTSQPTLAPDEVLSHLLFQKAAGSLTAFQAVQLAAAVATLTGKGGPGFLDKTRQALGVDTLDVNAGKDGPSVSASRYISRRVSVGVKAGTTPANSAATVKVDVTKRIKLLGEVGGDGRTSLGIGTEIEY